MRVRSINGDFIPRNAVPRATVWLHMTGIRRKLAPELLGEQMVLVPKLRNPWIRQPPQHRCARTGVIRRQNWFPYRKDADVWICIFLQNLFDCGRPPQTHGSRGREQQNNAYIARRRIERGTQLVKICGREQGQRRLPCRNRATTVVIPTRSRQSHQHQQRENGQALLHRYLPGRSARMPATA